MRKEYDFKDRVRGKFYQSNKVQRAYVVIENLAEMGTPISIPSVTGITLSREETLARGVQLARENATVAKTLPIAFAKSIDKIDFDRLKKLSIQLNEKRTLGFYLDLTGTLAHNTQLKNFARKLVDRRVRRRESFFREKKQGKFLSLLEKRNTPPLAKKWFFSMNLGMDSFESQFRKSME